MKRVYGLQFTSYAIELYSLYSYKGFGIGLGTSGAIGCSLFSRKGSMDCNLQVMPLSSIIFILTKVLVLAWILVMLLGVRTGVV